MKQRVKNVLIIILAAILIILFTPYFGRLYEFIIGHKMSSGFWGPSHPEYFVGFLVSYMFSIALVLTLFGGAKRYKNMFVTLGILALLDLFLGFWESLIISLGAALVGWLLAQVGLAIFRGLKIKI